jgi:Ca2+-binding RTX toxin-like protein
MTACQGDAGDDSLDGGNMATIPSFGGLGRDVLAGGDAGNDSLSGGRGTTTLWSAAPETTRLTGGAGTDDFVLDTRGRPCGALRPVTDYAPGDRLIVEWSGNTAPVVTDRRRRSRTTGASWSRSTALFRPMSPAPRHLTRDDITLLRVT